LSRHRCFAVCTPGLEPLLADELRGLGIRQERGDRGGIAFAATTRQLYAANLFLRTATRVLVRAASFDAPTFAALEREARRVPWDRWLAPGTRVAFRVGSTASRLYHTGAIAQRLGGVVPGEVERSGGEDDDDSGDGAAAGRQLVLVRVVRDRVAISLDASGEPLFRRGWRQATAKAPLRETLAAAMILATGWDGSTPFVDPLCGSGTIAIEAALLARGMAPGRQRDFAFRRWPSFEPGTWASVRGQAAAAVRPERPVTVIAADRDPGAVRATCGNAERAGVADALEVRQASLADLEPPAADDARSSVRPAGWVVTNPPYGVRVQAGRDLRELYATLGAVVRRVFSGWGVGLLVADPALAAQSRLRLAARFRTSNGGIPVRFLATAP
jgi:putative N6-adenine-specific DNA methylase